MFSNTHDAIDLALHILNMPWNKMYTQAAYNQYRLLGMRIAQACNNEQKNHVVT